MRKSFIKISDLLLYNFKPKLFSKSDFYTKFNIIK